MESIFTRRSIREYEDKCVEPEKLERVLRAGMQAPSAMNRQPWEIVVVQNREKIAKVAACSPFGAPAGRAPVVLVPLGNIKIAGKHNPFWPQDLSAMVENMLLQAVDEGLATCWMGVYPNEKLVSRLTGVLDLPENVVPFAMISLGYGSKPNHFEERFRPERVHYEKY